MIKTDKILMQLHQERDRAYPVIEALDKRSKTAQVRVNATESEVWTVHLLLPTNFEQCLVTDHWYVVKNVQPEN